MDHQKDRDFRRDAYIKGFLFFFILIFLSPPAILTAQEMSADTLLEKADSALYPDTFRLTAEIFTHKPGSRDTTMVVTSWYEEGKGTYMEIEEPARSRGTRFLQKEDALWMYNPRSRSSRAIRLSPQESFQDTAFSNNDLSDPDYADNYTPRIEGTQEYTGPEGVSTEVYKLSATARNEESSYGKIVMLIRTDNLVPVKIEYYAKSGILFKQMLLTEIEEIAGRQRPRVMKMETMDTSGKYSRITILELEALEDVPDSMFSTARLTQ